MPRPVKPPAKRVYESPKRAAQAAATRAAIVDAAHRLFTTRGYVATTLQAVADDAGVAVQTIYAAFGNKRELLRQVLEAGVTGDADPTPINERPEALALGDEPDARRRAAIDAALVAEISQRIAPIAEVLREAAAVEPEFAATAAAITARRREDIVAAAALLTGPGGPQLDEEHAVGTLFVLYSPAVYTLLTTELGWSVQQYEAWLAEMLYRALMRPS